MSSTSLTVSMISSGIIVEMSEMRFYGDFKIMCPVVNVVAVNALHFEWRAQISPLFCVCLIVETLSRKRAAVRNGVDLMVNIIFAQKSCWQIGWTPEHQPRSKVPSQGASGCLGKVENAGITAVRGVRRNKWGFQTQVRVRKVFSTSACPPLIPPVCEFCARASSWCPCLPRLAASVNSVVINDNRQRNSGKKAAERNVATGMFLFCWTHLAFPARHHFSLASPHPPPPPRTSLASRI